jgi:peptide/nickel transport system permease protein
VLAFIVRRLLASIPVILGVTLVTFAIMQVTAGGHIPGLQISPNVTPSQVEQIRENLGLDRPVTSQYLDWLSHAVRGDFGRSLQDQTSVSDQILSRLPATLELTCAALVLGLLIAIPVGVIGAVKRGSKVDHALTAASVGGFAIPQFWLGLILILLFSVQFNNWGLPALPQSGMTSAVGGGGIGDRLSHLAMPAIVLSFFYAATWSRYLRSSMVEVLGRDYIRTAFAKGMTSQRAILVHALRNAIVPFATLLGLTLPYLFSGALVVEIVFGWPGVGLFAYQRALDFDYTTVLGTTTLAAFLVVLGNLIADVLVALLDPRVASAIRGELPGMAR